MLTALRARVAAVRKTDDVGMTLTELIVGMTLSTILGALTMSLFLNIDTSTAASTDRAISSSNARGTLQAWTSYLRVADGPTAGNPLNRFEWFTTSDIMFHANLSNRSVAGGSGIAATNSSTMVWLRMDSKGVLIEELFAGNAPIGSAFLGCRALSGTAVSSTLFAAFDRTGAAMTGQNLGAAPVAGAGCRAMPITVPSLTSRPDAVAVANLQNISTVVLDYTIKDTRGQHELEFTSQATLPLLGGSV